MSVQEELVETGVKGVVVHDGHPVIVTDQDVVGFAVDGSLHRGNLRPTPDESFVKAAQNGYFQAVAQVFGDGALSLIVGESELSVGPVTRVAARRVQTEYGLFELAWGDKDPLEPIQRLAALRRLDDEDTLLF